MTIYEFEHPRPPEGQQGPRDGFRNLDTFRFAFYLPYNDSPYGSHDLETADTSILASAESAPNPSPLMVAVIEEDSVIYPATSNRHAARARDRQDIRYGSHDLETADTSILASAERAPNPSPLMVAVIEEDSVIYPATSNHHAVHGRVRVRIRHSPLHSFRSTIPPFATTHNGIGEGNNEAPSAPLWFGLLPLDLDRSVRDP